MGVLRHYEVMSTSDMTNHMWSGFNMLANQRAEPDPADIREKASSATSRMPRLQREDQQKANNAARTSLAGRGLAFNEVETAAFRVQLSGLYAAWKKTLGTNAWSLLEAETGPSRLAFANHRILFVPHDLPDPQRKLW